MAGRDSRAERAGENSCALNVRRASETDVLESGANQVEASCRAVK